MPSVNRISKVVGLLAVAGGCLLAVTGCGTGGGPSQMLEPTKPRMDREVETPTPAPPERAAK